MASDRYLAMSAGKPLLVSAVETVVRSFLESMVPDGHTHRWTVSGKLMISGEGYQYHWAGCEVLAVRCADET